MLNSRLGQLQATRVFPARIILPMKPATHVTALCDSKSKIHLDAKTHQHTSPNLRSAFNPYSSGGILNYPDEAARTELRLDAQAA